MFASPLVPFAFEALQAAQETTWQELHMPWCGNPWELFALNGGCCEPWCSLMLVSQAFQMCIGHLRLNFNCT